MSDLSGSQTDYSTYDYGNPGTGNNFVSPSQVYEDTQVNPPSTTNTSSGNYGYGPNEPYGSIQYATAKPATTTAATTAMGYSLDGLSLGYGTDGKIHIYGERRTLVADPADPKRTIYGYENTDLGAGDDLQSVANNSGLPLGAIQGKLPELQAQWYQTGRTNTQATLSQVSSGQYDDQGNLTYNVTDSLGNTTPMSAATVEGMVASGKLPGVTTADLLKAKGNAEEARFSNSAVNTYGYNYFNGGMYTPPSPSSTQPQQASAGGQGFSGLSRASTNYGGSGGYTYSSPSYSSGGSGNTMTTQGSGSGGTSGGYSYSNPAYTSGSQSQQGTGVNLTGAGMNQQQYGNQLTGLQRLYDTATTNYNLSHLNDIQNQQTAQRQQYFNTAATTGLSRQTTGEGFSGLQPQRLAGQ